MIINESGGGAGLNLKVVGGTTQPTNPAENTVWVNTDTEITSYAFSATQPENPAEGFVWFAIGAASNAAMNVDKKNTVMLYPVSCKQYINGAWVIKTAKTYQGGAWKEWRIYLYDQGEEFTDITGGWRVTRDYNDTKKNANSLYIGSGASDAYGGIICTTKKIYFTPVNSLAIVMSASSNNGVYVIIASSSDPYEGFVLRNAGLKTGTNEVDVSNLSGEYFLMLAGDIRAGSGTVTELWME